MSYAIESAKPSGLMDLRPATAWSWRQRRAARRAQVQVRLYDARTRIAVQQAKTEIHREVAQQRRDLRRTLEER